MVCKSGKIPEADSAPRKRSLNGASYQNFERLEDIRCVTGSDFASDYNNSSVSDEQ